MKKHLFFLFLLNAFSGYGQPCSTNNATNCDCPGGVDTCDLLPDITISAYAILNHLGGPNEFSQTGNGADDGRLRVSGSTPNIGFGSFTVGAEQLWTCGTDTFTVFPGTCSDGTSPKQLIKQKVYHKAGNTMSSFERWAGSMTYHPTHGHMHVDDWATFTLRIMDSTEPNPVKWPILGDGAKIGFCLMDYGTCSYYNGHCRDSANAILVNSSFVNYGLGGGNYNCSPIEQGISVGYTDIYGEHLDGMWIDIPKGTCNGDYWIVIEVDPNNNFLEMDETNNWAAVPYTLTKQDAPGNPVVSISPDKSFSTSNLIEICKNESVTLKASAGYSYQWSTGASTQAIQVDSSGTFFVTVNTPCGIASSDTIEVSLISPMGPQLVSDTICEFESATLIAQGNGIVSWYDASKGGNLLATGDTFNTGQLAATTTYFAEQEVLVPGPVLPAGPIDNTFGNGGFYTGNQHIEFYAYSDFTLESVKVYAQGTANRTIELRDNTGGLLMDMVLSIPDGESRITLNFPIQQGAVYQLGTLINSLPNLYRNNGSVAYPYILPGIVSIVTSSAGSDYFYYFYDWRVKTDDVFCASPRNAIDAVVETCTGIPSLKNVNAGLAIMPNPGDGNATLKTWLPSAGPVSIHVFDYSGRIVSNFSDIAGVGEYETHLSLNSLKPGLYYIRLQSPDAIMNGCMVIQ